MKTKMIKWDISQDENSIVNKIAHRAAEVAREFDVDYNAQDAAIDVTATHLNGCPIDLQKLLDAPDFDFSHDIFGIRRHLDRHTGELGDCFVPRYARPSPKKK
jgi:uncharacterized protein DUF6874